MEIEQSSQKLSIQVKYQSPNEQNSNFVQSGNEVKARERKSKIIAKQKLKKTSKKVKKVKFIKCQVNQLRKSGKCEKHISHRKKIEKNNNNENVKKQTYSNQEFLQFLSHQIPEYFSNCPIQQRSISKCLKQNSLLQMKSEVNTFISKFNDQNQIKALNLLYKPQQFIFKRSCSQNLSKYLKEAENFYIDLQKLNINSQQNNQKSLQKSLKLILSKKQTNQNYVWSLSSQIFDQNATQDQQNPQLNRISFAQYEYLKEYLQSQVFMNNCQQKKTDLMPKLQKTIIILSKCYKLNKKAVNQILKGMLQNQNGIKNIQYKVFQDQKQNSLIFYSKCLIKKCLIQTFNNKNVFNNENQILNFFKFTNFKEKSIAERGQYYKDQYCYIQDQAEYSDYIKRVKNKKIICKSSLPTACTACFSTHYERYNPILKCPECKSRVHKLCGKNDERCDKCIYKKISILQKSQTKKCFICLNQSLSLMLFKIKGNKYAHIFCLLVHNLWTINQDKVAYDWNKHQTLIEKQQKNKSLNQSEATQTTYKRKKQTFNKRKSSKTTSIKIDQNQNFCKQNMFNDNLLKKTCSQNVSTKENLQLKLNNFEQDYVKNNKCKFCLKQDLNQLYLCSCINCKDSFHILCAYLNGCNIEIEKQMNEFDIKLRIQCCSSSQQNNMQFDILKKKLTFSRRYKLNYERCALDYKSQPQEKQKILNKMQSFQQPYILYQEAKLEEFETERQNELPLETMLEEQQDQDQQ